MDRRLFIARSTALGIAAGLPAAANALPMLDPFSPQPDRWRTFELTTSVQLANGPAAAWIPVPALTVASWIKPAASKWKGNTTAIKLQRDPASGTTMVYAEWPSSAAAPSIDVVSRVATRDRSIDFKKPGIPAELTPAERARYSVASAGIVAETAAKITGNVVNETDKARAIYEWVVTNASEDPKVAGCGTGDAAAMLTSGKLGGKSADINGLFVALARAAGFAARVLYGIRVAPSQFGYASLGPSGSDVTQQQSCRAEVYVGGIGWIPADPAAVRHIVAAEPPGNLKLDDQVVVDAHTALFGASETNWIAYNDGNNVALPGSSNGAVPFLIYPQAETAGARLNPLAPATFRYTITAVPLS